MATSQRVRMKQSIGYRGACAKRLCVALLFGVINLACAGHAGRTATARDALSRGDAQAALASLNQELEVPSEKQLPQDPSGDNSILLLDRAIVLQQLENYELSSRDLEVADKAIEILDFSRSTTDEISRYVFSDDTGPYKAPPYEKLMVNTMNMLNYVMRGDLSGGKVEARRFAVMQKYLKDNSDSGAELLGPGSYFAGFIFEKTNDPDVAMRYYDEALQFGEFPSLVSSLKVLATKSSYRTPRLRKVLGEPVGDTEEKPPAVDSADMPVSLRLTASAFLGAPASKESTQPAEATVTTESPSAEDSPTEAAADPSTEGEVLVVINFGRVPAKEAIRLPVGLALQEAGSSVDDKTRNDAIAFEKKGLVTWINFPSLPAPKGPYSTPVATCEGQEIPLDIIPIDELTVSAWKKGRGAVIASAITRMVTRAVAGKVTGKVAGGTWGAIASLVVEGGMAAADTPDTRGWATLPARMAIGRMKLPAGTHKIKLTVSGRSIEEEVTVAPGGWQAVNLTVLKQK